MSEEGSDQLIEFLLNLMGQLGISMDRTQLLGMAEQLMGQIGDLGIDPEQIKNMQIDVKGLNPDLLNILNSLGTGSFDLSNLLGPALGGLTEIKVPQSTDEAMPSTIPEADVYLDGTRATVDIDCTSLLAENDSLSVSLATDGTTIRLMRDTDVRPSRLMTLPYKMEKIIDWNLNGTVLEVIFSRTDEDDGIPIQ
ncbi:MAG TPA: hypothetical protein QF646_01850 [Candidatus Poseidoniales archaeon]|nr:hypothetical protein [Candidatus Poseidoniales archaeon]